VLLGKNEAFQTVAFGKALDHVFAMFPCAFGDIAGDADMERAIRSVGHDVNPSTSHRAQAALRCFVEEKTWMAGTSPAMT
jgi:hypothetical protein